MGRIEAVILDWAGTTVDFGCFAPVQAFLQAFRQEGIEPTVEQVREPMGMLKRDHVKAMLSMPGIRQQWIAKQEREWEEADAERIYKKSEADILAAAGDFAIPKPYVTETVDALRRRGIRIGSTTGYTDEMMEIVAEKAKEYGYEPDVWVTPNEVENLGRPFPYMIYRNMQELKISAASRVIKVGDTISDIREGKNAGVFTVGVVEGSSLMGLSQQEMEALGKEEYEQLSGKIRAAYRRAGADQVIANLSELPALIEALEK